MRGLWRGTFPIKISPSHLRFLAVELSTDQSISVNHTSQRYRVMPGLPQGHLASTEAHVHGSRDRLVPDVAI